MKHLMVNKVQNQIPWFVQIDNMVILRIFDY